MAVPLDDVGFVFQPLVNLRIGGVVAVEALVREPEGGIEELYRRAEHESDLAELDALLAARAVTEFTAHGKFLPLHINVLASTVAHAPAQLDVVRKALRDAGRREQDVTLEINPPVSGLGEVLLTGVHTLRECGFRLALDNVAGGEVPLELVADLPLDMVKLDSRWLRQLGQRHNRLSVFDAVRQVCDATGARLVVDGLDNAEQLAVLRHHDVPLGQGTLLAPADRRPPESVRTARTWADTPDRPAPADKPRAAGPLVSEFLSPARTLPAEVSADEARQAFAGHSGISGIVLVDDDGRPRWTLDRDRFLLAVTGPYGHALHASKPAARLADEPRMLTTSATALEALELVTHSGDERASDDAVIVDEAGICLGVVPASTLVRGLAEFKVEEAASLKPLTRLPGSDGLAREVARRIDRDDEFTLSWLDINDFTSVNTALGFAGGDNVIRALGRTLSDAAASLRSVVVAHPGRDDFLIVAGQDDLFRLVGKTVDAQHETGGVPITLSLATLMCSGMTQSYAEASRQLAPLKRFAKSLRGDGWVLCHPGSDRVDILRGQPGDSSGEVSATEPAPRRPAELVAAAPVGIGIFDESERLVHANAPLCELLGYRPDQLLGVSIKDLVHPEDASGASLGNQGNAVSQRVLLKSDGRALHCELRGALSVRDDGSQFWVVAFHDITSHHRMAEELRRQATRDSLTGLPNRTAAKQMLSDLLATSPNNVAIVLCDVDNVQRITDSLGYEAGNDLFVALARRLENELPHSCTPAKLPGGTFLVLCSQVGAAGGLDSLATTVSSALRTSMPLHGQFVRVSASVGAAAPVRPTTDADDLLRLADAALLQAKARGAGRVSLAGPGLMTSSDRQPRRERELREALHSDGLSVHYQPVVDEHGTVLLIEAHVRWPHPDHGLLTPDAFLPAASQGELLHDLDHWVLTTALREAARWPAPEGRPLDIAIPLFGVVPDTPGFFEEVAGLIAGAGISPHRVVVRLSASSLVDLTSPARTSLLRITERGVRFALDDFGTGCSSLDGLTNLPAQIVRLASGLVSNVDSDVASRAIAQAVSLVACATGRTCIAEGVENAAQFRTLRELGVGGYQGGLWSAPLPSHELHAVVESGSLPVSSSS